MLILGHNELKMLYSVITPTKATRQSCKQIRHDYRLKTADVNNRYPTNYGLVQTLCDICTEALNL